MLKSIDRAGVYVERLGARGRGWRDLHLAKTEVGIQGRMGADSRSLKAMEKEEEQAFQRGESAEAEGGPVRPAIAISGKEVEALLGRLFEQLRQKSCGGSVGATSSTTAPISDVGVERMVMESLD